MNTNFYEAVKARRSFYSIGKGPVLSDEKILSLIEDALRYTPTAFNSQSGRIVVLLGKEHDALWDIAENALRPLVPPAQFPDTLAKLNGFRGGCGTLLYFEDQSVVEGLQKQFPLYRDNFPVWSLEASGMLQFVVWTALETEGYGASLQHYNPLIDEAVKKRWQIDPNWKLLGQMPFGKPTAAAAEKSFLPVEPRMKVFR